MESQERVELPAAFEDVDVDILVKLIGASYTLLVMRVEQLTPSITADMMERLMAHNDQIPLSPCVDLAGPAGRRYR